eukprot:TRINITY_DN3583_c0_g1_i2.p1 TRINITY_DN3583_c0_g1~~TRINITY_DN3583_c0_g1_i2.p1  ORF type:complete len:196 (-),score=17.89 TRINITY_DN3583_c0_g1_i2:58-645(-)
MMIAGTSSGTITFADLRNRYETFEWRLPNNQSGIPRTLCIDHGLNIIAVGQSSGYITLVDLHSGLLLHTWKAHDGSILNLQCYVMNDTHFIVSSSTDRLLCLWNISKPVPYLEKTFKGHREPIQSFDIHQNDLLSVAGHKIAAASLDSQESVVKLERMRLQKSSLKPNQLTTINILSIHQLILIGSEDGHIKCCF